MTNEERLAEIRAVGERLKALRAKQAPDSPLAGTAFDLAKLVGDMEREVTEQLRGQQRPSAPAAPERSAVGVHPAGTATSEASAGAEPRAIPADAELPPHTKDFGAPGHPARWCERCRIEQLRAKHAPHSVPSIVPTPAPTEER